MLAAANNRLLLLDQQSWRNSSGSPCSGGHVCECHVLTGGPVSRQCRGLTPPFLPGRRGVSEGEASQAFFLYVCVYVCVAAAHSVLFDSAGLIRHPAPWQRQGLNSSVKSLSTQTHACSPQRRRERIERSRRREYLCCLRYNAWGSLQSLCPCFSRACLPNSFQPGLAERKAEGGKKLEAE